MLDKRTIKRVGIVVKQSHDEALKTAHELTEWLGRHGIDAIGGPYSEIRGEQPFDPEVDLVVVLGGDGTIISTARLVGNREPLVLGINYGSVGYLTEFRIEEMVPALKMMLAGEYEVDHRVMLDARHVRDGEEIGSGRVLNDVVINKAALARIIEIEVHFSGNFVNTFRSDGLIVATPTGSTAYNLSAGGPIIYPSMNAIVVTPICPFTLTNRPIVIPDSAEIELKLLNENEGVVLTLDGQTGFTMKADDRVLICKSSTAFNLVRPANRNYFDVLRNKLKWGK
ncbi:MAG TPA: NAD(+)/NADH kinase [Pyrinomonadaceae bacterium]